MKERTKPCISFMLALIFLISSMPVPVMESQANGTNLESVISGNIIIDKKETVPLLSPTGEAVSDNDGDDLPENPDETNCIITVSCNDIENATITVFSGENRVDPVNPQNSQNLQYSIELGKKLRIVAEPDDYYQVVLDSTSPFKKTNEEKGIYEYEIQSCNSDTKKDYVINIEEIKKVDIKYDGVSTKISRQMRGGKVTADSENGIIGQVKIVPDLGYCSEISGDISDNLGNNLYNVGKEASVFFYKDNNAPKITISDNNFINNIWYINGDDNLYVKYDVYCSIAERDKYDVTNDSFFPMCEEDLKEETIESRAIVCGKDEPVTLFTVFVWDGEQILTGLHRKQEQFCGTVFMENEEYPVMVELKPCEKYKSCISELYFWTVQNGFLWKPVNDSLLDGFYEVMLVSGDLPRKKQIQKIQINFGRYSPVIRFHCFPVWNIEKLTMRGRMKKGADGKGIIYEHMLFEKGIKKDKYLIAEKNLLFYNHIHVNGTIISNTDKKEKDWKVLKIHEKVKKQNEFPAVGNQDAGKGTKNNFIRHKLEILDFYKQQNSIQNNSNEEKQFIWEYALEKFKWNICFEQLEQWSPNFEVHEFIEGDGTDKTYTCRYNAMYQYEEIFQRLYENGTYPAVMDERVLIDTVTHFLAELEAKRKYSLETYEKEKFEKDLCNGLYGEKCKDIYCMLPFHKQQVILHFLVLQNKVHRFIYEPAGDFDFYIKTIIGLLETGAVYKKKQEENSFCIYLGIRKNEYASGILYLAKVLFLPVGYKVRVFWQNHFPILNEKKTLKLGEMQLI